ncbi:tyrosine-type recombinase/integrase [Parvularcula flava]|uniref:Tyrosine-type recombinase/integrase n=1 Tax=Aquisalinus luteolus TaxID=1566827 RepID=A0A8J3EQS2_9PROT|nr:site-specific integrase [Aquisalinus luteolus]NHK27609.1 tyrosine-type recombinase/integrase [Aquisalinus luteolus]GGH95954.1 hypothetical protein GCM10011355_13720 [Aquisalinus luteolus]
MGARSSQGVNLTNAVVGKLPAPETGSRIFYDQKLIGFGCRVTATGVRSFILNYRTKTGRERRATIGRWPEWSAGEARDEAESLKGKIKDGMDPVGQRRAEQQQPTVSELIERFEKEYLPKQRPSTAKNYSLQLERFVRPALGKRKVVDVTFSDIDALHRDITHRGLPRQSRGGRKKPRPAPYQANRVIALVSRLFNLAIRWGWRTDNPAKGVERNQETKRRRYLSPKEQKALISALAGAKDKQGANIIRLLMLTGARRGEVLAAKWTDFDFGTGYWIKPGATTKQKTEHRVPLPAPALQLLSDIRSEAEKAARKSGRTVSEYVFPSRSGGHRQDIKKTWHELCVAADIVNVETVIDDKGREKLFVTPSARVHDLRHTYASVLASAGQPLTVIGALLGHTQPGTTHRYAHLFDDPLRAATERAAASIMPSGEQSAEVVPFGKGRE